MDNCRGCRGNKVGPDCMSFYRRPSIISKNGDFKQMDECCSDKKFPLCEAKCRTTTPDDSTTTSCEVGGATYGNEHTVEKDGCTLRVYCNEKPDDMPANQCLGGDTGAQICFL